jgi:hypothetical protein
VNIEIKLGRVKRDSRIFIDGAEVTRGVLDFEVDPGGGLLGGPGMTDIPIVRLKVWPRTLAISGELGEVVKADLLAHSGRRELRRALRGAVYRLFRNIRLAADELRQIWREAHPNNHERWWER